MDYEKAETINTDVVKDIYKVLFVLQQNQDRFSEIKRISINLGVKNPESDNGSTEKWIVGIDKEIKKFSSQGRFFKTLKKTLENLDPDSDFSNLLNGVQKIVLNIEIKDARATYKINLRNK